MNRIVKKIYSIVSSLGVAIVLLILIALYIIIGTLIPQHMDAAYYTQRYKDVGKFLIAMSFDDVYASAIFIVLTILFSINLITCTITSLRGQFAQSKKTFSPATATHGHRIEQIPLDDARAYFQKRHYQIEQQDIGFTASKYRWGVLGAAITHIGILIMILGGVIGAMTAQEASVNLLPGNEVSFDEKQFVLRLDDFNIEFDENGSISQYVSDITIIDEDKTELKRTMWVNNPVSHKGVKFYQASYGWISYLTITDRETKEIVDEQYLRNNSNYFHQDSHLTIYLFKYFPELAIGNDQQPINLSEREINPHYAVILYEFGNPIGSYIVGPQEVIPYGQYDISFVHSQTYTGLLFRTDPSFVVVSLGFIFIVLGMVVSFYLYPRFVSFTDGVLITYSRKNNWVFAQSVARRLQGNIADDKKE
ncbi:MAG: cytochrome c biogenesis protein ResB [Sphaerochaetaceae bacterium]|jgi:cytochrome c biogenesis protein|nr:cytochrome c biogenesis protein ResB [Sphaerochaetaceae bacterium]NLO61381.1 cytochrome c biogenesis protein ResB [Spirochaetales bacterium]MDD2405131.1 cytochrome c biogenesis protein ResB [Sphaerochaetaceae bacterium]MDD3671070.1 cytochrome c biogenesis protein ResB [Sphaerochaetaceae bacterium]MDD4258917.1 cytochrome c biogenesis protein ResB [Sphaerochaetaceae bacterium]